jgi:hypothetical protein
MGRRVFVEHALARMPGEAPELCIGQLECCDRVFGGSRHENFAARPSRPSHASDRIGVPQAAASNRRPDGHQPIFAMACRVTFRVRREDAKKAGCSDGGR